MERKKTALEYFICELINTCGAPPEHTWDKVSIILQKAKEMEEQQIIDAYNQDLYGGLNHYRKFDNGLHYYNETYTTEK